MSVVFCQADASCPPGYFALLGPCVTMLSTDPVVCGHPLIGYTMLSKSMMKKLEEAGNSVSLRDATTEEEICGHRGILPPFPLPQECGG